MKKLIKFGLVSLLTLSVGISSTLMAAGPKGPPPKPMPHKDPASTDRVSERGDRLIETFGYLAEKPATGVERGKQVFVQWCAICHGTGPGMAGTEGLWRKYQGALPELLEERTDLQPAFVEYIVRNGIASMPIFRKTEVSDADLKALNLYLTRNNK